MGNQQPAARTFSCKIYSGNRKKIWPASHEKGHSDITDSVDQDQPIYNIKTAIRNPIAYTARNISVIDVTSVKKCRL